MKVYHTGTNGLWVGILVLAFFVLSMLTLGGFLLGTPIGWAILTILVIRHFYKRYQRRKNFEAYTSAYTETNSGDTTGYTEASEFASAYRQDDADIKVFSNEDRNSAVDVEFKEI